MADRGAMVSDPGLGRWVTMEERSLRISIRNLDALFSGLALPVMLMLFFVYLLGGAIQTGTAYVTYVVPGVLLLCAAFGASLTAVSVSNDMKGGVIDRFRSMDVSGAAILGGHVIASLARNAVATMLVLVVAFLIGFRPQAGPADWLAVAGVLLAFILAMSWLSAAVGLLTRSPEAASGFTFFVIFLPYSKQRLRSDRDDAELGPGLRGAPTGDADRGDPARTAARHAGRIESDPCARLVRGDPAGFDRAVRVAVPSPHLVELTAATAEPPTCPPGRINEAGLGPPTGGGEEDLNRS